MSESNVLARLMAVALVCLLVAGSVWAQPQANPGDKEAAPKAAKQEPGARPAPPAGAPMPPAMAGMPPGQEMSADQILARRVEMMKRVGMPEEKIEQWKAMMSVVVEPDSPAGLVGLKEQLQLTDEQAKKLQEIEKESRQKALAILDDQQKTKFEAIKYKPATVMEMTWSANREMMRGRPGAPAMMRERPPADTGAKKPEGTEKKEAEGKPEGTQK